MKELPKDTEYYDNLDGILAMSTQGTSVSSIWSSGATVREVAKGAYSVLRKLSMPASPFHRIDIGQRLRKELPRLAEHGFAAGLDY
jgi:phosphoribosylamine-glycine ligase